MPMINDEIVRQLLSLQDIKYRDFHARLVPNLQKEIIIGVRTPALRKYASVLAKDAEIECFLGSLPHNYYEENNIHGFIIEGIKNFDKCIEAVELFLPYIDNWATCDMLRPKCFKNNTEKLYPHVIKWMFNKHVFTCRFAIGMLNSFYMDEAFDKKHLELVSTVNNDNYYVKMMIAWYFATALSFHYDTALPYLENRILDRWIHNKTIQKAVESFRISDEIKAYLRTLKV